MLQFQDEVMEKAREIFKRSDDLHMALSPNKTPTEFLPGSYVLVKYRTGASPMRLHAGRGRDLLELSETNDQSTYF